MSESLQTCATVRVVCDDRAVARSARTRADFHPVMGGVFTGLNAPPVLACQGC